MIKPYLIYYACSICRVKFNAAELAIVRGRLSCPRCGISREEMELTIVEKGLKPLLMVLGFTVAALRQEASRRLRKAGSRLAEVLDPLRKVAHRLNKGIINPVAGALKKALTNLLKVLLFPFRLLWSLLKACAAMLKKPGRFILRHLWNGMAFIYELLKKVAHVVLFPFRLPGTLGRLLKERLKSVLPQLFRPVVLPQWINRIGTWTGKIFWAAFIFMLYSLYLHERMWVPALLAGIVGVAVAPTLFGRKDLFARIPRNCQIRTGSLPEEFTSRQSKAWLRKIVYGAEPLLFFCGLCRRIMETWELGRMPDGFIKSTPPVHYFSCPSCRRELEHLALIDGEAHNQLYREYRQKKCRWRLISTLSMFFLCCGAASFLLIQFPAGLFFHPMPAMAIAGYFFLAAWTTLRTYAPDPPRRGVFITRRTE